MKLASVRLVTDDLPALADFYSTLTGTEPVRPFGPDDYAELHTEGSIIALVTSAGVKRFNQDAAVAANNRSSILEFHVDDVDAERARLDGHVTDRVQEPATQPWGNRSMLFRDPDGNLINVYSSAACPAPLSPLPHDGLLNSPAEVTQWRDSASGPPG